MIRAFNAINRLNKCGFEHSRQALETSDPRNSTIVASDVPRSDTRHSYNRHSTPKLQHKVNMSPKDSDGHHIGQYHEQGEAGDRDYAEPETASGARTRQAADNKPKNHDQKVCHRFKKRGHRCERARNTGGKPCLRCQQDDTT